MSAEETLRNTVKAVRNASTIALEFAKVFGGVIDRKYEEALKEMNLKIQKEIEKYPKDMKFQYSMLEPIYDDLTNMMIFRSQLIPFVDEVKEDELEE
jgi:hypothetical protein